MLLSVTPKPAGLLAPSTQARRAVVLRAKQASDQQAGSKTTTGISFSPFQEAKPVVRQLEKEGEMGAPGMEHSFARVSSYPKEVEAAMNEQINTEYTISYVYHSMSTYFDRDNVSLPGLAAYFREESEGERSHAQRLIDLQNTRGGRVKLLAITDMEAEFEHPEKGDALYAMELALSLEKLNFEKLMVLWNVADQNSDPQVTQYIEDMLHEQVKDIKQVADYVAQLRRVGKGHGTWQFDRYLAAGDVDARTV